MTKKVESSRSQTHDFLIKWSGCPLYNKNPAGVEPMISYYKSLAGHFAITAANKLVFWFNSPIVQ